MHSTKGVMMSTVSLCDNRPPCLFVAAAAQALQHPLLNRLAALAAAAGAAAEADDGKEAHSSTQPQCLLCSCCITERGPGTSSRSSAGQPPRPPI